MSDIVSPNDLKLLRDASAQLALAQTVVGFAQRHVAQVYGLKDGDQIEDDGTITRATSE